jgi:hypothetical protein
MDDNEGPLYFLLIKNRAGYIHVYKKIDLNNRTDLSSTAIPLVYK